MHTSSVSLLVNKVDYEEERTIALLNLSHEPAFAQRLHEEYGWDSEIKRSKLLMSLPAHQRPQRSIDMFKAVFGAQKRCVTYSRRCWIWTFSSPDKDARIWALVSVEGPSWEAHDSSNPDHAIDLRVAAEHKLFTYYQNLRDESPPV